MHSLAATARSLLEISGAREDEYIEGILKRKEQFWNHCGFYDLAKNMERLHNVRARLDRIRLWLMAKELRFASRGRR